MATSDLNGRRPSSLDTIFDFNRDERLCGEHRVPADMDAFIDAEFGKIYEDEETYLDAFEDKYTYDGKRQTELEALCEAKQQFEMNASPISPDSLFADIGDCDQVAERSRAICLEGNQLLNTRRHFIDACPSKAAFFDAEDRGKEEVFNENILFDRDKDSEMTIPNPEDLVVTEEQLCDIREDIGTCFKNLAPKLGISMAVIHNIDEDYKKNADKADALLMRWKQEKGSGAKVKLLVKALCDIGQRVIADKLLQVGGISDMPSEELAIHLKIKCRLTVNSHIASKVLLCEDSRGKKYIVKELDGAEWTTEEILRNEDTLARALSAVDGVRKANDYKRQDSLKRISAELDKLKESLKKHRVDINCTSPGDEQIVTNETKQAQSDEHKVKELEELLKSCEFQCQCWKGMFNGLVKLTGEVGALEQNNQIVRRLTEFTKELQQQEKRFFPRIQQIEEQNEQLNGSQLERLAELKRWQKIQSQQVEGIERLLACLLEQRRSVKAMNRRSEPTPRIWPRLTSVSGRRRTKTDSAGSKVNSTSSLNDTREAELRTHQISAPLNARRMCLMETDPTQSNFLPQENTVEPESS